jgi:tRNA1Val (adenine37-N6)-methyltransferase
MQSVKAENQVFKFKEFVVAQDRCAMKVGTDGVLLGAWHEVRPGDSVLDIGTGTGLLALMCAQRCNTAQVHAVEIDYAAFEQASENVAKCPWQHRIQVFHDSVQNFAEATSQRYNLIVSNPPFFSGGTFSDSHDRTSVRHTVKLPHGDLLQIARGLLSPDGRLAVILPYLEGLRFVELAKTYRLHCTKMVEVIPRHEKKVERLLLQFELQLKTYENSMLSIHAADGSYSPEYLQLTRDFYLFM